ncbi:hypothetical protein D9M71_428580 [compost metagenome]
MRTGYTEANEKYHGSQLIGITHQIARYGNDHSRHRVRERQYRVGADAIHQQGHENGADGTAQRHHGANTRSVSDIVAGLFEQGRQPAGQQIKHKERAEEGHPQQQCSDQSAVDEQVRDRRPDLGRALVIEDRYTAPALLGDAFDHPTQDVGVLARRRHKPNRLRH